VVSRAVMVPSSSSSSSSSRADSVHKVVNSREALVGGQAASATSMAAQDSVVNSLVLAASKATALVVSRVALEASRRKDSVDNRAALVANRMTLVANRVRMDLALNLASAGRMVAVVMALAVPMLAFQIKVATLVAAGN